MTTDTTETARTMVDEQRVVLNKKKYVSLTEAEAARRQLRADSGPVEEPHKVIKSTSLCPVLRSCGQYVAASTRLWYFSCLRKPPAKESKKAGGFGQGLNAFFLYDRCVSRGLLTACAIIAIASGSYKCRTTNIGCMSGTNVPPIGGGQFTCESTTCASHQAVGSPLNWTRVLVTAQLTHISTSWSLPDVFVWLLGLKRRPDLSGGWSGWAC